MMKMPPGWDELNWQDAVQIDDDRANALVAQVLEDPDLDYVTTGNRLVVHAGEDVYDCIIVRRFAPSHESALSLEIAAEVA